MARPADGNGLLASTHVVVLGAGFGGLEVASRLSVALGDSVRVTLIDSSDAFVFGFSKLDVMFGRKPLVDVRLRYDGIRHANVTFRQEQVTGIEPNSRRVVTDKNTYDADVLVIALGADLAPAATPGLLDCGYEFYSPAGAAAVSDVLPNFTGGNVVIGVLGGFFKCPPAPYEAAFMLHDYLSRRELRAATSIRVVTPMPSPIPISDTVSAAIVSLLDERGIEHSHSTWITGLDPETREVRLKDGSALPFDLFLGVPVHVAPAVVVESGLTDEGWIAVNPETLATRWGDVYAVGDITSVPVPRAGVIAEGEAATVAQMIVHKLSGGSPPAPYAGQVTCFIEMGNATIGKVDVDFLSGPAPQAVYTPPSVEGAEEKRQFAATRRRQWFGTDD